MKEMKKTVLFILSTNFSGSHFLSLLLGSHSKAAHVGEVKNLAKEKNNNILSASTSESTRQCYLCEEEARCLLLGDMHLLDKEEIYPTLFRRLTSDKSLIVDASKKTEWASHFLNNNEFDTKFIHLIRDPRALVKKWKQHYKTPREVLRQRIKQARTSPKKSLAISLNEIEHTYLIKWVNQNRKIANFLHKANLDSKLITYHDVATKPDETIKGIMPWLGLNYETSQLRYWAHRHHGTQKPNYDWVKEKKNRFIDLRWQKELSEQAAEKINHNKEVIRLISELNLASCPNGLTKKSDTQT